MTLRVPKLLWSLIILAIFSWIIIHDILCLTACPCLTVRRPLLKSDMTKRIRSWPTQHRKWRMHSTTAGPGTRKWSWLLLGYTDGDSGQLKRWNARLITLSKLHWLPCLYVYIYEGIFVVRGFLLLLINGITLCVLSLVYDLYWSPYHPLISWNGGDYSIWFRGILPLEAVITIVLWWV